jgi:MinD-like ATPase involved in chromosome partitioning or flagellar assembly
MTATVLGIVSIKGGVGKTTSSINLGAALAVQGKKTLVVDADFTSPNLGLHIGLVNPKKTLHHVFKGKVDPQEAVHNYCENLDILPCSLIAEKINPYILKQKLDKLRSQYDFIIIDAAPTLNEDMLATIIASDELLVVTSTDYPTLSATLHAVRIAKKQKTPIAGLILNRRRGKSFELTAHEIEEAAGLDILAVINESMVIPSSVADTTPALLRKPYSKASQQFKRLAAHLSDEEYSPSLIDHARGLFSR